MSDRDSRPAPGLELTEGHDRFAAGRGDVLLLQDRSFEERLLPAGGGNGHEADDGGDHSVFHAAII